MTGSMYLLSAVVVMGVVTLLLRLAPFVVLGRFADHPLARYLGVMMPTGVMVILVVYSLQNVDFLTAPYGAPSLAGVAVTAGLHHWRRNPMLSIVGGTAVYMLLLNLLS
ncbi:AzlD domain-containing protein [Microbispora sp. RL4-1S]|uniref:AzlD domain-containing protein n=1 Tax=Microbispora oryzae TaxID=2806554 RepID=A0A940WQX7_9ACTN|nr:AzlD domain-containing protein [Microbispora oryzae]MBP2705870.1 AzlD domain-containing protein [Microbispora oryzae]